MPRQERLSMPRLLAICRYWKFRRLGGRGPSQGIFPGWGGLEGRDAAVEQEGPVGDQEDDGFVVGVGVDVLVPDVGGDEDGVAFGPVEPLAVVDLVAASLHDVADGFEIVAVDLGLLAGRDAAQERRDSAIVE